MAGETPNTRHGLLLLESGLHLLAIALVYVQYSSEIPDQDLYKLLGVLSAASALRVFSAITEKNQGAISGAYGHQAGIIEYFCTALLGLVWGAIPTALEYTLDTGVDTYNVFPLPVMAAGLAVFTGSALHSRLLTSYALPACLLPIAWHAQLQQIPATVSWALVLLALLVIGQAGRGLEALIERFLQISRGNTDLVKNLAQTRDQALAAQAEAETANQALQREIAEREKAEQKIIASERELSRILDDMMDTYFQVAADGKIARVSPSVEIMLGYEPDDIRGRPWNNLFATRQDADSFRNQLESAFGILQNHEVCLLHRNGREVWVSINAHYRQDARGNTEGFEGVARDTTEARLAKDNLFREKELWQVTLESIADGVITTDLDGHVSYLNSVAEHMTGWSIDEAQERPLKDVMQLGNEADPGEPVELPMEEWLKKGNKADLREPAILFRRDRASESAIELSGAPIRNLNTEVIGSVMVFHDVTKLRALAMQLAYQATHDALTGLINRVEFDTRVEQAIHSANRGEKQHAMFYMDLDQFKVVNDTCGHPAGDELLKQISGQLRSALRESDLLARLGGDEFGVLLIGCPLAIAETIADKLRQLVEDFRFVWEDNLFRIGVSIGVVPINSTETGLTELMRAADSACYVAKENGRNQVHVSRPDDVKIAEQHGQMQWMQRIQRAVEENEFTLYFQPIQAIEGSLEERIHGEVLLRMVDEKGTDAERIIAPSAFLPAAERYHLMPVVDRWVLEKTLRHLANNTATTRHIATCSINLSGQSVSDLKMLNFITALITETDVDPRRLCFEITESAVIANMDVASQFVNGLRSMGCRFALDDFGSGLSTFDYLKRLNVDFVKLDGVLVRDVATNRVSQAMVHAINYVVHVMGMKSIAEYVESDEITEALRKLSVDYAQGYAIGKPEPFC